MQNISIVDGDKNGMKRRDSLTSHVSTNKSQNGDTDSAVGKVSSPKKAEEVESVEEVDDFVPSKHYDFRFSRQQLLDLKRVFDAYDDNRDGIIDIQYLGVVMRASGLILTDKDIVNITRDADPEDRGEIDLGKFFVIVARRFRDWKPIESAARKAFTKISKSNMVSGVDDIPLHALRNVLTSRGGEPFAELEVEEFMKAVQVISDKKKNTVSVKSLVQYTFGDVSYEELAEKASVSRRSSTATSMKSGDGAA